MQGLEVKTGDFLVGIVRMRGRKWKECVMVRFDLKKNKTEFVNVWIRQFFEKVYHQTGDKNN